MTWSDYLRVRKGAEPKRILWKAATISRVIQNPICVGYLTYEGKVWETDEGEPTVITSSPILTLGEWEAAKKSLASRTRLQKIRRRKTACLLTGIAICGHCGGGLICHHTTKTLKNGERRTYCDYRCAARNRSVDCPSPVTMTEAVLEDFFERALLDSIGYAPEMVKMVDAGEDHTSELEQKRERLNRLESDYAEGRYDTPTKEASYWRTLENLTKKIAELEARPVRPRTVTYQPTGRTWADRWKAMGTQDRREFLGERNVRVMVWSKPMPGKRRGVVVHFGNLKEFALAGGVDTADLSDWGETALDVPGHWLDASVLLDPAHRAAVVETYGTTDVPEVLAKVRAKTLETFPDVASGFMTTEYSQ